MHSIDPSYNQTVSQNTDKTPNLNSQDPLSKIPLPLHNSRPVRQTSGGKTPLKDQSRIITRGRGDNRGKLTCPKTLYLVFPFQQVRHICRKREAETKQTNSWHGQVEWGDGDSIEFFYRFFSFSSYRNYLASPKSGGAR